MSASENPSAFPLAIPGDCVSQPEYGMSLRDYFAGQVVVGLLSGQFRDTSTYNLGAVPRVAFTIAEAMLAVREALSSTGEK